MRADSGVALWVIAIVLILIFLFGVDVVNFND